MKKSKNVLLLALSTLKSVLYRTEYDCYGKKYYGFYQLEPVPKMLLEELAAEGGQLDEIIMLCTKECEKPQKISYEWDGAAYEAEISAKDFLERQIRTYVRSDRNGSLKEPSFCAISLDEKNPDAGIAETVRYLRKLGNISLYLDTHGGFRGIQLVMEAIISLLKREENINIKNIWGLLYGDNRSGRIVDESASFRIFDFVSGMNEFINYGRSESLKEFLAGTDDVLLENISEVSEGIQLCHVEMFENGLAHLRHYFGREHRSLNPYLDMFLDNIRGDYGMLLDEKGTVLDELRWCFKKGFYQQTLTLIEGRIPRMLWEKHVFDYTEKVREFSDIHRGYYEINNYIFNRCLLRFDPAKNKRKLRINDYRNEEDYDLYMDRIASQAPGLKKGISFEELFLTDMEPEKLKEFHGEKAVSFGMTSKKEYRKLYAFLKLHEALKGIRNSVNHGSRPAESMQGRENINLNSVKTAIRVYIKWAQELIWAAETGKGEKINGTEKNIGNV